MEQTRVAGGGVWRVQGLRVRDEPAPVVRIATRELMPAQRGGQVFGAADAGQLNDAEDTTVHFLHAVAPAGPVRSVRNGDRQSVPL